MTNKEAKQKLNNLYIKITYPEYREAINIATKCICKQIETEPINRVTYALDCDGGICPDCGREVNAQFFYCPGCGKKLNWEE